MDSMEVDRAAFRRQSIGTLTGWQLLAQNVEQTKDDAASSSTKQQHDQQSGKSRPQRSSSGSSDMSEDSGTGHVAQALVQPRPHQWLYKEYKIQDEIGSGGFGRVCRARRLTDGKVVVVKEIKTTSLSQKQKAATMDEVEVLAKFNHPNIVKYHDCFMDDVYINIVMEYCNAGDLTGLLKQRGGQRLPEPEIMSLFVQICLALVYVHSAGVLHRDLKCSNVLITSAPNFSGMPLLKLGDFGVAKISGPESSMASTIVGTPQYLSPEMCDNKPYGKKSDVWALGCILYELCTLTKAFDLGNGGISGIILKIIRGTYTPLPDCYSDDMKALVGSMLQTDPNARPYVSEILDMPYVRQHLQSYLEWARNVPEAHPEVLLTSLGEQYKRGAAGSSSSLGKPSFSSQQASSPTATAAAAAPAGDAGNSSEVAPPVASSSSGATATATMLSPQMAAAVAGAAAASGGSSDAAAAAALAAAAGAVELSVLKAAQNGAAAEAVGSGLLPELMQFTRPARAPNARHSIDAGPMNSSSSRTGAAYAAMEQPPPPQQQRKVPSWLEQQQQQHASEAAAAAGASSGVLPQQPLQHAAGGSIGSNGSGGSANSGGSTVTTGLWSQPLQNDTANGSRDSSKVSIAQEQMEGLKRLRGLKARMSVPFAWAEHATGCGSSGSQQVGVSSALTTLLSMDCETHVSHCAAML